MSIYYGECPPLSASDFPMSAPGGVDASSPPQPPLGAQTTEEAFDSLRKENAALKADNIRLVLELAAAQAQRDTANAQATHYRTYYTRTGW